MKKSAVLTCLFLGFSAAAHAVPVYTSQVSVGYDPNAPTSNFSSPSNVNSITAYDIFTGADSSNFYVDAKAVNPPADLSGYQFSNIYIGGHTFSGITIEVTNARAFITGGDNTPYDLTGTGFSFVSSPGDIAFTLPFSFLETDPLGMGFSLVSPGDFIRVSYSQSFGYSFDGGTALYGDSRLGGLFVPAPASTDVPEPASFALLGLGLAGIAVARRRFSA